MLFCIRNNTNKDPVFVANRLAIIEEHTDAHNWRHVPLNLNPADLASRRLDPEKLDSNKWLRGPSFLLNSESQWPETVSLTHEPSSEISSIKANVMQMTTKVKNDNNVIDRLIDRCSSLHKLMRFISYLQQRVKGLGLSSDFTGPLTVEELQNAETSLIGYVQLKQFPYLFTGQTGNRKVKLLPCFMQKLQPIIVDNIARVGGRVNQSFTHFDLQHPIILPQHNHFTELIIRHYHSQVGHSGTSHTWIAIRQKYWIIKDGGTVCHSVGQCV